VANAVLDGADGLLLGAETLRGLHPVLTVETVLRLCHAAEKHFDFRSHHEQLMGEAYEVSGGGASSCLARCPAPAGELRVGASNT
jgi:pyruvate kinase